MKRFIEIHTKDGTTHLVNVQHIVEVCGSNIYTDDFMPEAIDYPCFECVESYAEIKYKIALSMITRRYDNEDKSNSGG